MRASRSSLSTVAPHLYSGVQYDKGDIRKKVLVPELTIVTNKPSGSRRWVLAPSACSEQTAVEVS
jgi:hypothetical protein